MKTSLYHSLANKVDTFMALFEKIPIDNHKQGLPWEHFYYNYFTTMSRTLISSIFQVDYAKAQTYFKIPNSITPISLTFDSNSDLIRHIALDINKNPYQRDVLEYIVGKLAFYRGFKNKNTYTQISCSTLNNSDCDILLSGVLYHNSVNDQITFNLMYIPICLKSTQEKQTCFELKDLEINFAKDLKPTLKQDYMQSMQNLCLKYDLSQEQLEQYLLQEYGQNWQIIHRNEKLLKCLELVLFSDMDLHKIAKNHAFESWEDLKQTLEQNIGLKNPLIRYTQNPVC